MNNNDLVNSIRMKTDIVDIVGERIPLEKRGKNYFCLCPFHDDNSPSLCVSREKQIYTCFTCKKTGNVYTFLMEYDKMSFPDALRYLGERCGEDVSSIRTKKKDSRNDNYYKIYELTKKYYQNNLWTKEGHQALEYLKSRNIDTDIINEFEIGFSLKEYDDLTKLLVSKKYDLATLNTLGLSNDSHDIYTNRIIFPLYDPTGAVVGFSGRIYDDSSPNKYLNSKETPIFKKGECLYHYHIAREEARVKRCVIVMEGFMDVIRASTIGIKNTVALMGTALTKTQITLLKRLSKNIILCLDGDKAGIDATLRNGELLLEAGVEVKVVSLPDNDDPDTFILKRESEFQSYLDNAINFNDYKIDYLKKGVNKNSVEDVSRYINKVLEDIVKIDDPIRIEIILKRLAKEYNIGYNTLDERFLELKKKEKVKEKDIIEEVTVKSDVKDNYQKAIIQIVYYMLNYDWVISEVENKKLLITDSDLRILVKEIIYYYNRYGSINIADFITYLNDKEDILNTLNDVLSLAKDYKIDKDELLKYFDAVTKKNLKMQRKVLNQKIESEVDPIKQAEVLREKIRLRMGE